MTVVDSFPGELLEEQCHFQNPRFSGPFGANVRGGSVVYAETTP